MKQNITLFFKRNAIYLLVAFCILAVGLTVLLVAISDANRRPLTSSNNEQQNVVNIEDDSNAPVIHQDPVVTPEEPVSSAIIFDMPVANFSRLDDYSDVLVFNSTMGRFEAHKGIDFYAEEGTNVIAVYDGTVESVTNDLLKGYTIVINHGNGLKTIYNSLLDGDAVVQGQTVKKGDVIGEVSLSNRQEYKNGAHLHFEVTENGKLIDPATYLLFEEK